MNNDFRDALWVHRRHLFRQLWMPSILFGVYCAIAAAFEDYVLREDFKVGSTLQAVVAFLLGLMLTFRTNTAYDRWYEGRKLWGQLVNRSRGISLKARSLVGLSPPEREEIARLVAGFAFATRDHLRNGQAVLQEVPGFREDPATPKHVPVHLALRLYERFQSWRTAGRIDGFTYQSLDRETAELMDIVGGCERIRNTPLAHSYRVSIHHMIVVYLFALPWTLQNHYWIPAVSFVAAYFLLGLELIAADIEDPFGVDIDDLPLDTICAGIEKVSREVLVDGAPEPVPA